ncbi:cytochrome c oxidase subunit II [Mariniblastus fucicola]|uniref:Cytochrome c oxidase subunit 2 n=1 Tax=Mariniblastus fucicola TaxID=980251 RepID=A0A5B9P5S3_9BACT|nr:cytochrome c oxidase subunit II [Mariniblastus fucicola]QEG20270.1 Alternative cytochrome c oxidase subunit 2 [Mariniblastus fucicola]
MNWSLPILFAQSNEEIRTIVSSQNNDTSVPDHAIERSSELSGNWFSSEYWFPESASTFASNVDWLFMFIFWVSLIFFAAIVGVMIHFCIKYRRKDGNLETEPSSSHNTSLEIAWSVGPSILLVVMFWYGAEGFFQMRVPRTDAEEIQVSASRWNWKFTYPDGDSSSELHLVNNRPTKLVMQSEDVLHSMYIASFRQKVDIVPGRYTYAYLEPNKEGQFRLACTEYCGQKHSKMRTMVTVHASDERRKEDTQWIEADYPAWQNGERIYKINCSGCHNKTAEAGTGPGFGDLWGKEESLMGGSKIKVDEQYVYNSIMEPNKDIVAGYGPVSKMNSFQGKLSPEDVNQVIAYLKYLKDPTSVSNTPEGEVIEEETETPAEPEADKTST